MGQLTNRAGFRLIGAILIFFIGYTAGTLAKVFVSESLYFEKNTPLYFMLMHSSLIERIPSEGTEVKYYWTGGDGPKPPALGIEIVSNSFPSNVISVLTNLLRGCAPLKELRQLKSGKKMPAGETVSLELICAASQIWVRVDHADKWHVSVTEVKLSAFAQ